MAVTQTTRFQLYRWSSGADQFTRAQMTESHDNIEAEAAGYTQAGTRPAAAAEYAGFFHYDSTDSSVGTLSYCNGTAWFDVGALGSVTSLDGTTSDGTSNLYARADHTHALDDSIVTTSKINDLAVTTGKINDLAVTTGKIAASAVTNAKLGSDLDASKLTAGTLSMDRIASGAIVNDKLASGIDATKLTTGTMPIARIADAAVTLAKIEDVAANSILARTSTSVAGVLSELTAGSDSVLRRDGSGALAFGTIDGNHIANDAINSQHYVDGSIDRVHLSADIIDGTKIADESINSEHYVDGSIDRVHLAADIIDGTKIANDVINSEHYVAGSIDKEHLANNIVDNTKLADMAAHTVKIRQSSTGNPQDLTVGENRVVGRASGGTVTSLQVNGSMIADNVIDSKHYVDGSVDDVHIAAVSGGKITSGTVLEARIDSNIQRKSGTYGYSTSTSRSSTHGQTIFIRDGGWSNSYGSNYDIWIEY